MKKWASISSTWATGSIGLLGHGCHWPAPCDVRRRPLDPHEQDVTFCTYINDRSLAAHKTTLGFLYPVSLSVKMVL
ncbi:hypothetical protein Ct61P_06913 [Colletotrichum tofieldiae]|nr:hypothetical protein Ct61P_06913 [Colletotrichum tofieldiae]